MAGTLGRWTVEQEAAPGRLSLRKPVGSALLLGRDLAYLGILSGFAYGLATSVDAIWSNGGQSGRTWLVVGFLVLAGLVLFVGRKVVQGLFNVLRLQVADGKLVLQSGPLPRWTRHALELEWIVSVEVDWTDNETEAPGQIGRAHV